MYKGLSVGYTISKTLDRGIIELLGPQGLSTSFTSSSKSIAKFDTGNLTDYALYMGIALVSLTCLILTPILLDVSVYGVELLLILVIALITTSFLPNFIRSRFIQIK